MVMGNNTKSLEFCKTFHNFVMPVFSEGFIYTY